MAKKKVNRDDIRGEFGHRVQQLRIESEMTQEELAFEAELDRSFIAQVERGMRNVTLTNIEKIAYGLDCAMHELFEWE